MINQAAQTRDLLCLRAQERLTESLSSYYYITKISTEKNVIAKFTGQTRSVHGKRNTAPAQTKLFQPIDLPEHLCQF